MRDIENIIEEILYEPSSIQKKNSLFKAIFGGYPQVIHVSCARILPSPCQEGSCFTFDGGGFAKVWFLACGHERGVM